MQDGVNFLRIVGKEEEEYVPKIIEHKGNEYELVGEVTTICNYLPSNWCTMKLIAPLKKGDRILLVNEKQAENQIDIVGIKHNLDIEIYDHLEDGRVFDVSLKEPHKAKPYDLVYKLI